MKLKLNKKNIILIISILFSISALSIIVILFGNITTRTSIIFSNNTEDSIKAAYTSECFQKANTKIDSSKGDFNPDEVPQSNITQVSTEQIIKRSISDSSSSTARILMLGDSHLMGQFGDFLQLNLHETGFFDILSISIGGAGSATFTYPMKNNCCGYIIRESIHNEKISSINKIRKLEYQNHKTNEIIGKKYKGHLEGVLTEISPDIVIVALGSNLTNNHQGLINIIKENSPTSQIVWVGPMKCKKIGIRVKTIQQAVVKNNIFFVRSDDIVGSDSLNMEHLCGIEAKNWANNIFNRMKPLIDRYSNQIANNQIQKDTLRN